MRRFFVIFLILLFPLNALALSLSVATTQHTPGFHQPDAPASSAFASALAKVFEADTPRDLDPDEPPAMDLHDIVNHELALQLPTLPARADLRHDARRHHHSLAPPVKPPRTA